MPVNSPPTNDTRSRLADWLEIRSLTKSRQVATRADFLALYDLLDDDDRSVEFDSETGESLEPEILEDARSTSADEVFDELEYRADVLRGHYPFELDVKGQSWRLLPAPETRDSETEAGRCSYLFCLLTSAIRDDRLQGDDAVALRPAIPRLFQAISAKAAAGVLGGDVISFGWPRPGGSAFQPALRDVSRRLQLGKPLDNVPLWSKGQEKDSGIDVIAWRDFADKRPGKLVLFGQVASGNDWIEKTVKNDTSHFLNWFSQRPTEHFIPAIFIPFPQHHDCAGRRDEAFESVAAAEAWRREQQFGLVIDRLRIVGAAAQHLSSSGEAEEEDILATVGDWITAALTVARASA